MNKNRQFNEIFDRCLERLNKGATIEQCLAEYPEQAGELRPLLETVTMVKQAAAVSPRPELKAQLQRRLRAAAQPQPRRETSIFGWSRQWATGVAIALTLVMAGSGTVVAAASSMPDSTLYPVKQASEQVRMKLTFTDVGKAELYAKLADVRMKELDYLETKNDQSQKNGKAEKIEEVNRQLDTALERVVVLASARQSEMMTTATTPTNNGRNVTPAPSVSTTPSPRPPTVKTALATPSIKEVEREKIEKRLTEYSRHEDALTKVLEKESDERAKAAIEQALKVSRWGHEQALKALERNDDGDEAPKLSP